MNTNTNTLSLSTIAASTSDISVVPASLRDAVELMRGTTETVSAKTAVGRMYGAAVKSLVVSGRKSDKTMGILLASAESGDKFWKSEGDKTASKFFQRVTGASDTTFHAVKWAGENVYLPAALNPGTAIEEIAAYDVSASTLYELRALSTDEIQAAIPFLTPVNQKVWRDISGTVKAMRKDDKDFDFIAAVMDFVDGDAYNTDMSGVKAWTAFKEYLGFIEPEKPTKANKSTKAAKPAVTTSDAEPVDEAAAMRLNVYTVHAGKQSLPIGAVPAGVFADAMKRAGYVRVYSGNPDLYSNSTVANEYPYVVVTWTAIDPENVRADLLKDPIANGAMDAVIAISRMTDAEILANVPTLSIDDVADKLNAIQ